MQYSRTPHPIARFFGPICLAIALLFIAGCRSEERTEESQAATVSVPSYQIKLLIVENPQLQPAIQRQWNARTESQITIGSVGWEEFHGGNYDANEYDVIIYPTNRIGELVEHETIQEIDPDRLSDQEFNRREILQFHRNDLVRWGDSVMAVSLGDSIPVLLCRSDVLERLDLDPPDTWEAFSEIAERLADATDLGELPTAIGVPLQDHWASYTLMARVAASVRSRGKYSSLFDVSDMTPLIDTDPYFRALNGWSKDLGEIGQAASPEQVLGRYAQGDLAMAMVPLQGVWLDELEIETLPPTRIVAVPGSERRFDFGRQAWIPRTETDSLQVPLIGVNGSLASVVNQSESSRNAVEFLMWLADKKISVLIAADSPHCGVSRKSHLGNPSPWVGDMVSPSVARQYADVVESANKNQLGFMALRAPARDEYLNVLDAAVMSVLMDGANAVEQLSAAAIKWNAITDRLGREGQQKAYRMSEGLRN